MLKLRHRGLHRVHLVPLHPLLHLPEVLVDGVLDEANQRDRSVNVLGPVAWTSVRAVETRRI